MLPSVRPEFKQLIERNLFGGDDTDGLQEHIEAGVKVEPLLDDGNEHINADFDPDLIFSALSVVPKKFLITQVLLDLLEDEFDLSGASIAIGDDFRRDREKRGGG